MDQFRTLGLSDCMLSTLSRKGFSEPTPIQKAIIPFLLEDSRDVLAQAQTGTGKTAAFGIPMLERLDTQLRRVQALVLVPTRELAVQVAGELRSLSPNRRCNIIAVYGGQSFGLQIKAIKEGAQIVVGTPGRILDHIRRETLNLSDISQVVLDEADEMLDMGFIEDIQTILSHTPEQRRTLLFSATMPREVRTIAKQYMSDYEHIAMEKVSHAQDLTDQIYYEVSERDKFEALCRVIDAAPEFYGLVFCRTRLETSELASKLSGRGYSADGMHGEISQDQREHIMRRFRNKTINILVATDVAARGIDINNLTHVVNYDLPQDADSYVHRVGRTGRAGKKGTAVSLVVMPKEGRQVENLRRTCATKLRKGHIPTVKEIMTAKRQQLHEALTQVMQEDISKDLNVLADELLAGGEARDIVAACLQHVYADVFDSSKYADLTPVVSSRPSQNQTRLRVARGKKHGMNPQKLAQLIREQTGVKEKLVRDIEILNDCAFISVPKAEAMVIERKFRHKGEALACKVWQKRIAA